MTKSALNFADGFFKAIPKFFQVGGFALVFGAGGMLLIILAGVTGGRGLSGTEIWVGCALTFICLAYFLADAVAKIRSAKPSPIIGEVEELSSLVKDISSISQSIAFKYQGYIQDVLSALKNAVGRFPFGDSILKTIGVHEIESYSKSVVEATEAVKKISDDIEAAVREGDAEKMREYVAKLKDALRGLRDLLTR